MDQRISRLVPLCLGLAALVFTNWLVAQEPGVGQAPTDSDLYCAGFFTNRIIEPALTVMANEDGGLKNELADRDIIYLSKGRGTINAPGAQYMLVRPVKDINPREFFPGQRKLLLQLGTPYAEVARIQVQVVHEASATAEVLTACEPVLAGDIAIPLTPRPAPPFRPAKMVDRFAPSSGKATGVVVAGKDLAQVFGEGNIVYLNVGKNQGAQVGSYLRVFRTPLEAYEDVFEKAAGNYATEAMGVRMGRKLTRAELATLPRKVLGEVMLLSVEEGSSAGIVTFSREEISSGDAVEME